MIILLFMSLIQLLTVDIRFLSKAFSLCQFSGILKLTSFIILSKIQILLVLRSYDIEQSSFIKNILLIIFCLINSAYLGSLSSCLYSSGSSNILYINFSISIWVIIHAKASCPFKFNYAIFLLSSLISFLEGCHFLLM